MQEVSLDNECKVAFKKAKTLINNRIAILKKEPIIQEFDDGNLLFQFFHEWDICDDQKSEVKFKKIKSLNDSNDNDTNLIFVKENSYFDIRDSEKEKKYVLLNGEIEIFCKNGKRYHLNSFQTITIKENVAHGGVSLQDSYILVT